ncbi:MAG: hypothetical protein Q8R08_04180 [bacterium]|nr:hypothetical protein [bacterium]
MRKSEINRIQNIFHQSLPPDERPILSEEQLEKLKNVTDIALAVIGTASLISIALVAPNMLMAIDKIFLRRGRGRKFTRKERATKMARTFYYMKQRGLIRMKMTKKDVRVFLTSLGRKRLKKVDFGTVMVKKPGKWDGKWWGIAADIPTEDYKWAADLFRKKIKEMKFFSLQRTLWFYPDDPRNEIEFIAKYFGIGQFVTVMEVSRLDKSDEKAMIRFFKKEKIL